MPPSVRTRFAPSPTGRLHLGNVRTAAFNWLLARRHGGSFVLRIEDTDVARNVPGGEVAIMEDLRWLGLDWDEGPDVGGPHGPYRQSERTASYTRAVDRLLAVGAAYPCFCSQEELEEEAEELGEGKSVARYSGRCRRLDAEERARRLAEGKSHVIRFAVPEDAAEVVVEDEIFGHVAFPARDLDDFVLRRSDGRVTYNFAVVVDDMEMEISHVVRGVGHLSNTPKQALLFDAFGAPRPVFAHLPTVLGPDGRKLSKRLGATAVAELRAQGYPPDAVLNYLSLLGWSHPSEKEVLSREELVRSIDLARVGKSDTKLDPDKLRWIAQQHLAAEPLDVLAAHTRPFLDEDRYPDAATRWEAVVDVLRTRLSTYGDIGEQLQLLYPADETVQDRRAALGADPETRRVLEAVRGGVAEAEPWEPVALDQAIRAAGAGVGAKGAALFHPVRVVLIGSEKGPDLGKVLAAIGRDEALRRFARALGRDGSEPLGAPGDAL
ncbi:MAG TPA: glutamate--tRNA ligase [Longimicrobiales bacterium]|nr:glutamate--tRNA ligase [Longimicrobiales bacterium]